MSIELRQLNILSSVRSGTCLLSGFLINYLRLSCFKSTLYHSLKTELTEDSSVKHSTLIPVERIEKAIYLIRGEKVILDRDLAELYEVETRVLNQAVGRNRDRFPSDFMLELTRDEINGISQIVTSSRVKFSKRVTAFTEQGVAMLSVCCAASALFRSTSRSCEPL
jgi:hypothetical protein